MNKRKEADLCGIGFELKTSDHLADNQRAFSMSNFNTDGLESLQSILQRMFTPKPKVCRFDWKRQKPGRITRI